MQKPKDLKLLVYEDRVQYLSELHANILFWLMRGDLPNQVGVTLYNRGLIDKEWDWDTVQRELTEIYRQLGVPGNWAPKTKNSELKNYILPAIKSVTNDDPERLIGFPLKKRTVNRQWIDNARQWINKYRQYWWIPAAGLLVLGFILGAFLLGRGTAQPDPAAAPTHGVAPNPTSPSTDQILPTASTQPTVAASQTIIVTQTEPVPATQAIATTASDILFTDNFNQGMNEKWKQPVEGAPPIIVGEARSAKFDVKTKYIFGDSSWTNYEVSLAMTDTFCQAQGFSKTVTIGMRYQESGEMIAFRWLHWENDCEPTWLQGQEGRWIIRDQNMFPLPAANPWRMLAVSVQRDDFFTSHGGPITIPDVPSGGVVLIIDGGVIIDNFVIRVLP